MRRAAVARRSVVPVGGFVQVVRSVGDPRARDVDASREGRSLSSSWARPSVARVVVTGKRRVDRRVSQGEDASEACKPAPGRHRKTDPRHKAHHGITGVQAEATTKKPNTIVIFFRPPMPMHLFSVVDLGANTANFQKKKWVPFFIAENFRINTPEIPGCEFGTFYQKKRHQFFESSPYWLPGPPKIIQIDPHPE